MRLMRSWLRVLAVAAPLWLTGCGARTGLHEPPPDAGVEDAPSDVQLAECITDEDCPTADQCSTSSCVEGVCMPAVAVDCDDHDPCTEDTCTPATGKCKHRDLALDQDGDGYKGPRPGYAPGAPGSCGDDCDDTNPNAHPGGIEICDGVDNDCNGIIDDNMTYVPSGTGDVRVSGPHKQAGGGGVAFNGNIYAVTYSAQEAHWKNYFKGLTDTGQTSIDETSITKVNNDTFTGPIVWTGAIFGTVWEDCRNNDYEIYFNRLDKDGQKLAPDLRITSAGGFSLEPALVWNGTEFLVTWTDQRAGGWTIYGQRISVDGDKLGGNVELTNPVWFGESSKLAEGTKKLGLAFNMGDATNQQVGFRLFGPDFSSPGSLIQVSTDNGTGPAIVYNGDRYVVVFSKRTTVPGNSIWGATVDENGNIVTPETRLTKGAKHARTVDVLALGDRLLLVWADDHDGNYELYSKMLSPDLKELAPRARITKSASDTLDPIAAFGPNGDVGVLFDDDRSGNWQTYFTRLVCKAGATP